MGHVQVGAIADIEIWLGMQRSPPNELDNPVCEGEPGLRARESGSGLQYSGEGPYRTNWTVMSDFGVSGWVGWVLIGGFVLFGRARGTIKKTFSEI
jgi:hypothetical protein